MSTAWTPIDAPPANCGPPTAPGWYWAKIHGGPWRAVRVYRDSRGVLYSERGHGTGTGAWCSVHNLRQHPWGQQLLPDEPRPEPLLTQP